MSDLIEQALREADRLALTDEPYLAQVIRDLVAHIAEVKAEVKAEATTIERCAEATRATIASIRTRVGQIEKAHKNFGADSLYRIACASDALLTASLDLENALRAIKPSGEKPVNPYLLGGSSTQSEG